MRKNILRLGLWLISLSLLLSFLTPFAGVPSLQYGIWSQSEPPSIFLHGCVAMAGLGFLCLMWGERRLVWSAQIRHPLVLIAAALALWSALTGLFHDSMGLTWFGSPEIGMGVFRFVQLGMFLAASLVVLRLRKVRAVLVGVAALVTVVVLIATSQFMQTGENALVPYYFTDYLAFNGLFLLGMALPSLTERKRPYLGLAVAILGIVAVVFSDNRAAVALCFVIAPFFGLVLWGLKSSRWGRSSLFVRQMAVMGTALGVVILTGFIMFLEYLGDMGGGNWNLLVELGSRSHLLDIVSRAIDGNPFILAHGNGWGSYSQMFAAYLPTEWATLRDDRATWELAQANMAAGAWDAVQRVDFHSHNEIIEALLSTGIIGAVLLVSLFALLPLFCSKRNVVLASAFALASSSLAAMWFLFPMHAPLLAFALAGFGRSSGRYSAFAHKRTSAAPRRRFRIAIASLLAVLMGTTTLYSAYFATSAHTYLPSEPTPTSGGELENCTQTFSDVGQGGQHLLHRLRTYARFVERRVIQQQEVTKDQVAYLRGLICASETYLDTHDNIHLAIGGLSTRANFAFIDVPKSMQPLVRAYFSNWGERLEDVLTATSNRADLAAPYLMSLLSAEKEAEFAALAHRLYNQYPNAVVPLWFSGIALLASEKTAQAGLARMKRALTSGIERILPVDSLLKEQLGFGSGEIGKRLKTAQVRFPAKPGSRIVVEVADTPKAREKGLSQRTHIADGTGMLLIFPKPQSVSVWMKDTYVSLDLVFIGENGNILRIIERTSPRSERPFPEVAATKSVLEVPAGTARLHSLRVGDSVEVLVEN